MNVHYLSSIPKPRAYTLPPHNRNPGNVPPQEEWSSSNGQDIFKRDKKKTDSSIQHTLFLSAHYPLLACLPFRKAAMGVFALEKEARNWNTRSAATDLSRASPTFSVRRRKK